MEVDGAGRRSPASEISSMRSYSARIQSGEEETSLGMCRSGISGSGDGNGNVTVRVGRDIMVTPVMPA